MEVNEIQEDTDSNQEFEEKMKESYNNHRDLSRSVSSSRPETAPRFRDDHERHQILFPFQVYSKISSFITSFKISRLELSHKLSEYPTFEKFKNTFSTLGLELTDEEIATVFKDNGSNKSGLLKMTQLYTKIITEVDEEEIINFDHQKLKEEATKLLEDKNSLKTRQKSESTLRRPITGTLRTHSSSKTFRPATAARASKNYLLESQAKFENANKDLALTVDNCKKEFEYECLHKMGEANEIAQALELPTTYRAVKKEDGVTKCHIYMNDHFVEEISLENFLRE